MLIAELAISATDLRIFLPYLCDVYLWLCAVHLRKVTAVKDAESPHFRHCFRQLQSSGQASNCAPNYRRHSLDSVYSRHLAHKFSQQKKFNLSSFSLHNSNTFYSLLQPAYRHIWRPTRRMSEHKLIRVKQKLKCTSSKTFNFSPSLAHSEHASFPLCSIKIMLMHFFSVCL